MKLGFREVYTDPLMRIHMCFLSPPPLRTEGASFIISISQRISNIHQAGGLLWAPTTPLSQLSLKQKTSYALERKGKKLFQTQAWIALSPTLQGVVGKNMGEQFPPSLITQAYKRCGEKIVSKLVWIGNFKLDYIDFLLKTKGPFWNWKILESAQGIIKGREREDPESSVTERHKTVLWDGSTD